MTRINHRPLLYDTDNVAQWYTEQEGVPVWYVCTTALDEGNIASDIFYRETPHPQFGNKYFGIYQNPLDLKAYITNADKVEDFEFACGLSDSQFVYSQHRHDMITVDGGAIDGGRAYFRSLGQPDLFTARVKDGTMVVVDYEEKA